MKLLRLVYTFYIETWSQIKHISPLLEDLMKMRPLPLQDWSTCYIQHQIFDEVAHDSVSHTNNNQSGHQEVQNGFREMDDVPGSRPVLLVKGLPIMDQVLVRQCAIVCVVKAVHVPSLQWLLHHIQGENVPDLIYPLADKPLPKTQTGREANNVYLIA